MDRFKNILFVAKGVEGDVNALRRTAKLAMRNKADLTIAVLVPDATHALWSSRILELTDSALAEAESRFASEIADLKEAGVTPDIIVLPGKPWLEIIRRVVNRKHDLVVLSAEAEGNLRRMLFGSISMNLFRKCPCSVWVPNPGRESCRRILVALDPMVKREEAIELNVELLRIARSIATLDQAKLIVETIVDIPGATLPQGGHFRVPQEEVDRYGEELKANTKKAQQTLVERAGLDGVDVELRITPGNLPGNSIAQSVDAGDVDLVVMGSVYKSGISGLFMGNNAERILQQISCGVFTAKPKCFKSPVDQSD